MSLNPEQVAANNNTPIAIINLSGNSTTVSPGIPITFDGTQSYDPDNTNIIAYNWWYVDGVVQSQGSTADKKIFNYTFTLPAGVNSKTYQIKLTVRDNEYITASKTITITITLSGRTEYYLTDHLGSIRTTIDQNGTVIGFDDYDPFGNVLPGRSYNAGTPNDLNKFTGHERDQEGGLDLDYMLARNYDSELGRFYIVDPLASKFPAWSPYNYTMNNPLRLIDPDGKAPDCPECTDLMVANYNNGKLNDQSVKELTSGINNIISGLIGEVNVSFGLSTGFDISLGVVEASASVFALDFNETTESNGNKTLEGAIAGGEVNLSIGVDQMTTVVGEANAMSFSQSSTGKNENNPNGKGSFDTQTSNRDKKFGGSISLGAIGIGYKMNLTQVANGMNEIGKSFQSYINQLTSIE